MLSISLVAEEVFEVVGFGVTNSLFTTWTGIVLVFLLVIYGMRSVKPVPKGLQLVLEAVFGYFLSLCESVLESKKAAFRAVPFITTIFVFVLMANIFAVIPGVGSIGFFKQEEESARPQVPQVEISGETAGLQRRGAVAFAASGEAEGTAHDGMKFVPLFRPGSADLNMTIALALISVVAVQIVGFKTLGLKYLKKFFNFSNPISFFVGMLELVSEFAKVISFSFRLFGNIFAGEVLLTVMLMLVPYFVPVPFYGLELFVSVVQAFVFAMLTLVFIKLATISHDVDSH